MYCQQCGQFVEAEAFCPYCGAPTDGGTPPPPVKKTRSIGLVSLVIVAVIVIALGVTVIGIVALPALQKEDPEPAPTATECPLTVQTQPTTTPTQPPVTTVVCTTQVPTQPPVTQPTMRAGAYDPTYLIPGSDTRYLTQAEVDGLSTEWLIFSINEIYARHGYIFNDDDFGDYFMTKTWYTPTTPASQFSTGVFNDCEEYNIRLLKAERKTRG